MTRSRARRDRPRWPALALALGGCLAACGPPAEPAEAGPWPRDVAVPGVLGYVAIHLAEEDLAELLTSVVGSAPRGLGGGPLLVIPFDPKAFGGALGVVLPVRDEELFEASLQLMPGLAAQDDDRWRLSLPADSLLAKSMGVYELLNTPPSALGALGAVGPGVSRVLGGGGVRVVSVEIDVADGWAAVVPTFEARGVARKLCRRLTGLRGMSPRALVAMIDTKRFGLAYSNAFEVAMQRVAAATHTMASLAARDGGMEDGDPLLWNAGMLAGLPRWLGLSDLTTLGIRAILPTTAGSPDASASGLTAALADRIEWEFHWIPGSRLDELMMATLPAPEIPGALHVQRWRADWIRDGGARAWMKPMVDALDPRWRAASAAGHDALAHIDGLIVVLPVGEATGLFLTVPEGERFDWPGLAGALLDLWPEPGRDADPEATRPLQVVSGPDGILRGVDADGDVVVCAGQVGRVAWCLLGEIGVAPEAACRTISDGPAAAPASGPWLRARWPVGVGDGVGRAEMTVDGPSALLDMHLERGGDR